MKKIIISDGCVACGICVPMSSFLEELPNGKVIPIEPGTITDKEALSFGEVVKVCPVHVISVENAGMVKSRGKEGINELKKLITAKFENYKVTKPAGDLYRFRPSENRVPYVSASGENRYDYRDYDKAERAGLNEFDRVMYSQKRALIQQYLVEFKYSKLSPFNCYEEQDSNFYYRHNREIEKVLKEFISEARDLTDNNIQLPNGFDEFLPKMEFGRNASIPIYQLGNIEKVDVVDHIASKVDSLSEYRCYINVDDYDNGDRYMHCYNLREVIDTFGKDLLSEAQWVINDFLDYTMQHAIEEYNRALKVELENKMRVLIEALSKASAVGSR